jgi:hypothetical protein
MKTKVILAQKSWDTHGSFISHFLPTVEFSPGKCRELNLYSITFD